MDRLAASPRAYGIVISIDKNQTMVNAVGQKETEIHRNVMQLEQLKSFKYLGPTLRTDGTWVDVKES